MCVREEATVADDRDDEGGHVVCTWEIGSPIAGIKKPTKTWTDGSKSFRCLRIWDQLHTHRHTDFLTIPHARPNLQTPIPTPTRKRCLTPSSSNRKQSTPPHLHLPHQSSRDITPRLTKLASVAPGKTHRMSIRLPTALKSKSLGAKALGAGHSWGCAG